MGNIPVKQLVLMDALSVASEGTVYLHWFFKWDISMWREITIQTDTSKKKGGKGAFTENVNDFADLPVRIGLILSSQK